jgi:hypothetical protein
MSRRRGLDAAVLALGAAVLITVEPGWAATQGEAASEAVRAKPRSSASVTS